MYKKTKIVIFIFPWEIDKLENTLRELKKSSLYLDLDKEKVIIDVTMNYGYHAVEWEYSAFKPSFFKNKFLNLKKLCSWCHEINFDLCTDDTILGCVDKRRIATEQTDDLTDIIWLDPDLYFHPYTLNYVINSRNAVVNSLQDKYYIISPQTPKLWDNTWDSLVQNDFKQQEGWNKELDYYTLAYINEDPNKIKKVRKIDNIKFGGGWFNLFSIELLKKIPIPDTFAPYGREDLYLMVVCENIKHKIKINQYVVENIIVAEKVKDEIIEFGDWYKDYITISLPDKKVQRAQTDAVFNDEVKKIIDKINLGEKQ